MSWDPSLMPMINPVSCCGKKPFGIQTNNAMVRHTVSDHDGQRDPPVSQGDDQSPIVEGDQRSQRSARPPSTWTPGLRSGVNRRAAHHRRQRERYNSIEINIEAEESNCELAEQSANDAAHQQQRNEDRDQ